MLELTFLSALPEVPKVDVLAALIVFRGFYLLLPFALAIMVVAGLRIRPVAQSTPRSADPLSRRRIGKHYDTPYRPRWSGEDASHRRSCSPLPTYPMS